MDNRAAIWWFRAEVSQDYDPNGTDLYALSRPGDNDFWESGILRNTYSGCRQLVKALVRFQYPGGPSGDAYLVRREGGMREFYKKLNHLYANVAFEFLSEDQIVALIEVEAEDLPRNPKKPTKKA
jgi:hypothetical protein